jgi:hypothetical protein
MICTLFLFNFILTSISSENLYLTEDEVVFYHDNGANNVKLYWITKIWPDDLVGFSIKKRTPGGNWQDINDLPIVPEVSGNHFHEDVLQEESFRRKLIKKRDSLISVGALKNISKSEYRENLKYSSNLKLLSYMFEIDYDKALISGFGLIDFQPYQGLSEYGLFPVVKE